MNKPCPFCGGEAKMHIGASTLIFCGNSSCSMNVYFLTREKWNTRTTSEDQIELARTAGEALTACIKQHDSATETLAYTLQAAAIAIKALQDISKRNPGNMGDGNDARKALSEIQQLSKS